LTCEQLVIAANLAASVMMETAFAVVAQIYF